MTFQLNNQKPITKTLLKIIMYIKPILLLSFLLSPVFSICGQGCLRCDSNNDCLLPDIVRLYKLDNETAVRVSILNCLLLDLNGKCLSCNAGNFLDTISNECFTVADVDKVPNCEFYDSNSSCLVCIKDHQLSAATCVPVEKKINNCEIYSAQGKCIGCVDGFLLSLDLESCVPQPSLANCSGYSYVMCENCKNGFAKNLNSYIDDLKKIDSDEEKLGLLLQLIAYTGDKGFLVGRTSCETAIASNCAEFTPGKNQCSVCQSGFYKTEDNLCEAFPDNPIANCAKYSSSTNCRECNQGHYFQGGECVSIPEVSLKENCVAYDPTISSIRCIKCSDNFYIPAADCLEREKSKDSKIGNCAEKNIKADKCAKCNPFFHLADDGLECMSLQSNCETYNTVNSGNPLKCNKCLAGFYLKTNTVISDNVPLTECIAGSVDECNQYEAGSSTNCLSCKSGFVLENTGCESSNNIPGCNVFSQTDKTKCLVCTNTGDFNFVIDKTCQSIISPVQNCEEHNGGTPESPICSKCEDTYELVANKCNKIQINNCLTTNGSSVCLTCKKGLARTRNFASCVHALAYMSTDCEVNSTIDESNDEVVTAITCNVCKEHTYPIDFQNHFACVSNGDLDEFATDDIKNNCLKYDENRNCLQCNPNETAKYLKLDGTCDISCNGTSTFTTFNKVEMDTSGTDHQIKRWNICVAPVATELAKAPNLGVTGLTPIVVSCPAGYITTITTALDDDDYTFIDPREEASFPYVNSPFSMFTKVTCVDSDSKTIHSSNATNSVDSDKCDYYKASGTANDYDCIRCKHKHTSTISDANKINDCQEDINCQSNRLYNIGLYWEKLFSCHFCTNTGIPFIAYSTTSTSDFNFNGYKEWDTTEVADKFENSSGTKKNIECLVNSPSTFGKDSSSYGVDDNCALGVVLTDPATDTNYTLATQVYKLTCAACKPGYAPTAATNASGTRFVSACTEIQNCNKTGNLANACEVCRSGYIHAFNNNNIEFSNITGTCLSIPGALVTKLENCWAAIPDPTSSSNAKECAVCKKGFHLNADKYCEELNAANCRTGNFRISKRMPEGTVGESGPLNWSLYQQSMGIGCNQCETSFSAIKITQAQNVCFSSNWIANHVNSITNISETEYIPNCKLYKATEEDSFICEECDNDFVLKGTGTTANGQECYSNSVLHNCVVALNASICLVCKDDTFSLVKGSCSLGNINNCKAYNYNQDSTNSKCVTCQPGFYLTNNNTCEPGAIPSCSVFEKASPFKCNICNTGFSVVEVSGSIKYCYPLLDNLNCQTMTLSNDAAGGKINCNTCSNKKAFVPAVPKQNANSTVCLPFALIPNCVSYDVRETLTSSTFKCTACSEKFYLAITTNECKQRINLPNKCTAYKTDADECTSCGSDSYLSNNNKECKDFPTGILGCRQYNSIDSCGLCGKSRYLNANECPKADPLIDNCKYYSSAGVCSECEVDHVLTSSICERAIASKCITYTSLNTCETCSANFGLETNNGITSCVDKSKPNCAIVDDTTHECTLCQTGFFLEEGKCSAPAGITNCQKYSGKDICETCFEGFALTVNKKSCVNDGVIGQHIPNNCSEAKAVETPICSRCGPGHYFSGEQCVELCEGSAKEGCFICDVNDRGKCFTCVSGYYMEREGVCKKERGGSGDDEEFARRKGVVGMMIIFLLAFIK